MITLHENWWYLGWWFVGHNPALPIRERMDWLCVVWKEAPTDTPEVPWIIRYRFCYHRGEGLELHGAPASDRHWYGFQGDGTSPAAEIAEKIELLATVIGLRNQQPVASVPIEGDMHKALALL